MCAATFLSVVLLNRNTTTLLILRSGNVPAGWAAPEEHLAGYLNSGPGFEPGTFLVQNGSTGQELLG